MPLLKTRLHLHEPPDEKQARRWIAELDSDEFETRQAAFEHLAKLGWHLEPVLTETLKGNLSLEMRRRLEQLLNWLQTAAPIRDVRAVQVLELIGNTEARTVLQSLANGPPIACRTREAQEPLRRLAKRAAATTGH